MILFNRRFIVQSSRVGDIEKAALYQGLSRRETLWWAITSVISDELYPHRVFMAK